MTDKIMHIAVLMGGFGSEREVSINTGKACMKAMNKNLYKVSMIDVGFDFHEQIQKVNPDICFNALHGTFGEDGAIQSYLNKIKIPYTHSNSVTSNIAFNKLLTKSLIRNVTKDSVDEIIFPKTYKFYNIEDYLKFLPLVVKPVSGGSSVEVFIVKNREKLYSLKNQIFNDSFLVEPFVGNRELTVTVFNSKPLAVTEIISNKNFFYDYSSKYKDNGSLHVLPAELPIRTYNKVLNWAKRSHEILGCSFISRSDFRYDDINDKLYMLEINTQPGMTKTSLTPEQANYCNLSLSDIIDTLIRNAHYEKQTS